MSGHPSGPNSPREPVKFPRPKVSAEEHDLIAAERRRQAEKTGMRGIALIAIVAIAVFGGWMYFTRG